ncbi:MAG: Heterodimeric efflux ABC transporter, permease/ATP-binding subunit 2, partial [uncultured Nocardioides sp.]
GRVRGLRRPAHPHQPRRRPARLVGAHGTARVDDRLRHRRADLRRRAERRLVGGPALPDRGAAAGGRAAVVPRPRQGRLPPRERDVLRHRRDAHRDRGGVPHRRGARYRGRADRPHRRRRAEVLRRRALHAVPAHGLLPEHGGRLPAADGGDAALRRLPLHAGHRVAGRGDHRDPVRADAHRPRRPHRLDPRRAADGRRLPGPPPRCGAGARRPGGHRRPARRREDRGRGRPLLLRRGPRRAARGLARRGRRRADRDGRTLGRGQVDARPAPRRHPPAPVRVGHRRRRRARRPAAVRAARPRRAGDPGAPRLRRVAAREPRARGTSRCRRRGDPRGARRRRRPGVGRGAARRPGHRRRLRRPGRERGAGAADRAGPAGAGRPAHARARRGDLAHRPAGRPAPRALAGRRARGPHRHRDRPPPLLRLRRRPRGRGRGRRDLRARLARRAGRRRRLVRRAVGLLERQAATL